MLHPFGRLGVGKNQGVVTTEYPLLRPSDDVVHLLADMCLVINPHSAAGQRAQKGGLRFYALRGFGTLPPEPSTPGWLIDDNPPNTHDCVLVNGEGTEVLRTLDAIEKSVVDLQDRLRRVVWTVEHEYSLVLTYHTKWPEDGSIAPRDYKQILLPESALICDSVVQFAPETKLFVLTPDADNPFNPSRQRVQTLNDGYNTTIRQTAPDPFTVPVPDVTLVWSVDAGSGLGRIGDCNPPLQTINGVPPNAMGVFTIGSDGCTAVHGAASVSFHNDCRACCDCDDYAQAGTALDAADSRYRQLAIIVEDFRSDFVPVVEKWNEAVACANSKVLSLQFAQRLCPAIAISMTFCNAAEDCAQEVVFALTLAGGVPEINDFKRVVRPDRFVSAMVSGPGIVVRLEDVPAKTKETVLLTVSFPQLSTADRPIITGSLQAAADGRAITFNGRVVQVDAEVALRCPAGDDDFINL